MQAEPPAGARMRPHTSTYDLTTDDENEARAADDAALDHMSASYGGDDGKQPSHPPQLGYRGYL